MVTPFFETDIIRFLVMAMEEGWICDRWEFEFLLRAFPQGCLVWRDGEGDLGYITSIGYGKSGWIGNLLVHPDGRRRGIGRTLMGAAMDALVRNGVETIWLTASERGAGLYQQLGFRRVDQIMRWTGQRKGPARIEPVQPDFDFIRTVDGAGWGEARNSLLEVTCGRGSLYSSSDGFLCCQRWEDGVQIGPWGALVPQQARKLLAQALAGPRERVFLDVPAGNHLATLLLEQAGFTINGSTTLMYFGATPPYRPHNVFALASMGSMG